MIGQRINQIRQWLNQRYDRYVREYTNYAKLRGFDSFNDARYHLRGFIICWAAPGFHRFWQIWNPGITYFVYKIYLKLGGKKKWIRATILAFFINGLIHHMIFYMLSGQWSFTISVLFLLFGIFTVASRASAPFLKQNHWPWPLNGLINIALVIFLFDISFRINHYVMGMLYHR